MVPTLDAKLVDEDGADLPAGPDTVGQLCVRGAGRHQGLPQPSRRHGRGIRDGWFNTGDIARIDEDGFVFIVDRAKDMVLRGGENVYCSEVEAAIYQHDAVAEAAVFGVPDERLGRGRGRGGRAARRGQLDADELRAFLDGRIAKHKIPATIWFRDRHCPATPTASSSSASCGPNCSAPDRQVAVSASRRSRACWTSWTSWARMASMPSNLRSLRRKWAKRTSAGSP